MDKFKKLISGVNRRTKTKQSVVVSKSRHFTEADREKFAQAVVRDFGETLVLLGKE